MPENTVDSFFPDTVYIVKDLSWLQDNKLS